MEESAYGARRGGEWEGCEGFLWAGVSVWVRSGAGAGVSGQVWTGRDSGWRAWEPGPSFSWLTDNTKDTVFNRGSGRILSFISVC